MNSSRPGQNRKPKSNSSSKLIGTIILIISIIAIFWYNLRKFQNLSSNPISTAANYLPEALNGVVYNKPFFSLSYVEKYELPEWVSYRLTKEMIQKPNHPRTQEFEPDQSIKTGSAHYHDYKQSGYSKGHLVPSADMSWDLHAMNSTFLMSNVAPMKESFNSGIWLELEHDVRDWAYQHRDILVVAGPIFKDSLGSIGQNDVLVPKYFYKAVFSANGNKPEVIGFIFDQTYSDFGRLDQYIVPIDSIEKVTGLDLFANMYGSWDNEIQLEKKIGNSKGEWVFNEKWYEERMQNK